MWFYSARVLGMKRLNPDTGEPFKRGDMRDDGKVFYVYSATVGKNGFKGERWITVSELDEIRALHRSKWTDAKSELKRQSRKKIKSLNPKKRLNPITGKPFRSGDKDQNSSRFSNLTSCAFILSLPAVQVHRDDQQVQQFQRLSDSFLIAT